MTLPSLKIAFLDVGHGDSIVIILPDNNVNKRAVVIDTPNHRKTIEFLEMNNVKTLELVLISHFDTDHSKGVSALIKHFMKDDREVKKISYKGDRISRSKEEHKNYRNLLSQLISFDRIHNDFTIVPIIQGSEKPIKFSDIDDLCLSILYPRQSDFEDACLRGNCNDTSTVIMVNYHGKKVLLPGDLESKGWFNLIEKEKKYKKDTTCDVLKLPHHGDYYFEGGIEELGTKQILDLVCPKMAIISTAQNEKYKHPSVDTITLLRDKSIDMYCTQVTDICHADRKGIKQSIFQELACSSENYINSWCPCSGDIILTIDNEVNIEPSCAKMKKIKLLFDNPQCICV